MISGNIKLFPIESSDGNFRTVYSTIRTITSDDTQLSRRSIRIDMPVALKTKINLIKGIQKEPTNVLTYIYIPR